MSFSCRIYVDDEEIYSGELLEVPEDLRSNIRENLADWSCSLDRRSLNELIYSLFSWYDKRNAYCENCGEWKKGTYCEECGAKLIKKFVYERSENLDRVIACIGVITRIEASY